MRLFPCPKLCNAYGYVGMGMGMGMGIGNGGDWGWEWGVHPTHEQKITDIFD